MENFALIALVENLRPMMADLLIRRVIQQQANGFIFQTRSARIPAIKVLLEARNPAIYTSETRPPTEAPGSDFLMILRKHLTSAEIVDFRKPLSERVIEFVFKTTVPSRELETMSLVVELIPNAPNLILLDAERRLVSSWVSLTPQHGMGEYEPYSFPKSGDKLDLEQVLEQELPELDALASVEDPQAALMARVAGLGPVFAAEILHRQKKSGRSLTEEIRSLVQHVRSDSKLAWLYTELPLSHILEQNDLRMLNKATISPVELETLQRSHSSRLFANIQEAARFYYDELESLTLLDRAKLPVLRDLRTAHKKLAEREKRLQRDQQRYEEAEAQQKTARMLTSSGMKMDEHYDTVTVTDYFGDKPQRIQVPLDSSMSLRENIDKLFKLQQKASRGRNLVARRLSEIRTRRGAADEQVRRLQAIRDWDTWLAIAGKLEKVRTAETAVPAETEAPRRRFRTVTIDGREILIGRNSRENEEVTFHAAMPDDFWLHVADYSGSHVVVRNPNREIDLDESILVKAAQLAAYFSQARNSSKVEVHYTKRKHVAKPKRSKTGLVRLAEFKSVKVEPKNWE